MINQNLLTLYISRPGEPDSTIRPILWPADYAIIADPSTQSVRVSTPSRYRSLRSLPLYLTTSLVTNSRNRPSLTIPRKGGRHPPPHGSRQPFARGLEGVQALLAYCTCHLRPLAMALACYDLLGLTLTRHLSSVAA